MHENTPSHSQYPKPHCARPGDATAPQQKELTVKSQNHTRSSVAYGPKPQIEY